MLTRNSGRLMGTIKFVYTDRTARELHELVIFMPHALCGGFSQTLCRILLLARGRHLDSIRQIRFPVLAFSRKTDRNPGIRPSAAGRMS